MAPMAIAASATVAAVSAAVVGGLASKRCRSGKAHTSRRSASALLAAVLSPRDNATQKITGNVMCSLHAAGLLGVVLEKQERYLSLDGDILTVGPAHRSRGVAQTCHVDDATVEAVFSVRDGCVVEDLETEAGSFVRLQVQVSGVPAARGVSCETAAALTLCWPVGSAGVEEATRWASRLRLASQWHAQWLQGDMSQADSVPIKRHMDLHSAEQFEHRAASETWEPTQPVHPVVERAASSGHGCSVDADTAPWSELREQLQHLHELTERAKSTARGIGVAEEPGPMRMASSPSTCAAGPILSDVKPYDFPQSPWPPVTDSDVPATGSLSSPPSAAGLMKGDEDGGSGRITCVTWSVGGLYSNPFEYWVTHDDPTYLRVMEDVQVFIDRPLPHQDVDVSEIFTDHMFEELAAAMTSEGWHGVDETRRLWQADYSKRSIITGFLHDVQISAKRLVSTPDRVTSSITLAGGGTAHRPTPISNYMYPLQSMSQWWYAWKAFMFEDYIDCLAKRGGVKRTRPCSLLVPLSRRTCSLTVEEETVSLPLQALCCAIFDAIMVHVLNTVAPCTWHAVKGPLCAALATHKIAQTIRLLEEQYLDADVVFLQDCVSPLCGAIAHSAALNRNFRVLVPDASDRGCSQTCMMLVSRHKFLVQDARDITAEVRARVAHNGCGAMPAGGLCAFVVPPAAGSQDGKPTLMVSFQGEADGLNTVAILDAICATRSMFAGPMPHLICGLNANAFCRGVVGKRLGAANFASACAARGLGDCWAGQVAAKPRDFCTTFKARTCLQPQLHKSVSRAGARSDAYTDRNPKDYIMFDSKEHEPAGLPLRDNTGVRGAFDPDVPFPTLKFPSDHAVVLAVLTPAADSQANRLSSQYVLRNRSASAEAALRKMKAEVLTSEIRATAAARASHAQKWADTAVAAHRQQCAHLEELGAKILLCEHASRAVAAEVAPMSHKVGEVEKQRMRSSSARSLLVKSAQGVGKAREDLEQINRTPRAQSLSLKRLDLDELEAQLIPDGNVLQHGSPPPQASSWDKTWTRMARPAPRAGVAGRSTCADRERSGQRGGVHKKLGHCREHQPSDQQPRLLERLWQQGDWQTTEELPRSPSLPKPARLGRDIAPAPSQTTASCSWPSSPSGSVWSSQESSLKELEIITSGLLGRDARVQAEVESLKRVIAESPVTASDRAATLGRRRAAAMANVNASK